MHRPVYTCTHKAPTYRKVIREIKHPYDPHLDYITPFSTSIATWLAYPPAISSITIIEAEELPRVSLHGTQKDGGVMRMFDVDAIDIPAGETVALKPGAMHILFMDLNGDPFEVGEAIPTLIFAATGKVDLIFNIEARATDTQNMDHSGHETGNCFGASCDTSAPNSR